MNDRLRMLDPLNTWSDYRTTVRAFDAVLEHGKAVAATGAALATPQPLCTWPENITSFAGTYRPSKFGGKSFVHTSSFSASTVLMNFLPASLAGLAGAWARGAGARPEGRS